MQEHAEQHHFLYRISTQKIRQAIDNNNNVYSVYIHMYMTEWNEIHLSCCKEIQESFKKLNNFTSTQLRFSIHSVNKGNGNLSKRMNCQHLCGLSGNKVDTFLTNLSKYMYIITNWASCYIMLQSMENWYTGTCS